jgi:hypothetical protein
MMLCNRIVAYMNRTRALVATEADVNLVEREMISGNNPLTFDKFDNLLTAGDSQRDSGISPDGPRAMVLVNACWRTLTAFSQKRQNRLAFSRNTSSPG